MFYRKKLLLAVTEIFGGEISATDFQKLLFIFSNQQSDRKYEFIPYKFGCFSFQAMADKNNLVKDGYLENTKSWKLTCKNGNFINSLNSIDRNHLQKFKKEYSKKTSQELIKYVYTNYPYYAINSEIATKYLSNNEIEVVRRFKPTIETQSLFTIGYEGRSIEKYLNILINKNIKVLFDVRKNPISRKYGFSKKTLQNACEAVGIKYKHIPELGIISDKRKSLKTQKDYDDLFLEYEHTTILKEKKSIKFIYDIMNNYNRVALTCFEALPIHCHRTRVANAVHNLNENIPLKHL